MRDHGETDACKFGMGWLHTRNLVNGEGEAPVADLPGSEETLKKVLRLMVKGTDAPLLARMENKSDKRGAYFASWETPQLFSLVK